MICVNRIRRRIEERSNLLTRQYDTRTSNRNLMFAMLRYTAAIALLLTCLGSLAPTQAFLLHNKNQPASLSTTTTRTVATRSTHLNLFNFLNEGKKALVKKLAGDYDAEAIQARLNSLVQDNPVLMLSFTTCPFCIQAKQVLDARGAKYTVVELDEDADGKAMRAEMGDMLGRTSVPAIWIGGTFVGGCNDGPLGGVLKLAGSNQLDDMLAQAKAI